MRSEADFPGMRDNGASVQLVIAETLKQAGLLRQQGRHSESVGCLRALLDVHSGNGTVQHALSISCRLAGDYDESIRLSDAILERQPRNPAVLLARIETASHFRRLDAALAYAEAAIEVLPGHLPFLIRKGKLLRQVGRHDESAAHLIALRAAHLTEVAVLRELVLSLHMAGCTERCLTACQTLLASDPQDTQTRLLQVNALGRLRRFDEALSQLDVLLSAGHDNLPAQLRKGNLLREAGRYGESIRHLVQLSESHSGNALIASALATTYRVAGEFEAARRMLDQVLSADPAEPQAMLNRLEVLHLLGDRQRLDAALAEVSSAMASEQDPTRRLIFGTALCKGLGFASLFTASKLLRLHRADILALAPAVPAEHLWTVYVTADKLGLAPDFAALPTELFTRPVVAMGTARSIMMACYKAGLRRWEQLATHIIRRVRQQDRTLLWMEYEALSGSAAAALALRKNHADSPSAPRILLVSRLLKQQGRIRLAARYLGYAQKLFGTHPAVFHDYLVCLIGSGQGEKARQVLMAKTESLVGMAPQWCNILAQGWAEIDQPHRAVQLLDAAGGLRGTRHDWYVTTVLSGPDQERARKLADDLRDSPAAAHLSPTIQGLMLVEGSQQGIAEDGAEDENLTLHAIRRVALWIDSQPEVAAAPAAQDTAGIPHDIVQYWSQGTPPQQVMGAVMSWQGATGFTHQLFDRRQAKAFLLENLGSDWLKAFNRAGSPTEESDFFRLCYLGIKGGIYADCDDWLIGDARSLTAQSPHLTAFREPTGAIGNNVIAAPPRHPAVLWAALSAKRALSEGHSENIWGKTGPGLLTRAIASHINTSEREGTPPSLCLLPLWMLGRTVQFHSPLSYKFGGDYWNAQKMGGGLRQLARWSPPSET